MRTLTVSLPISILLYEWTHGIYCEASNAMCLLLNRFRHAGTHHEVSQLMQWSESMVSRVLIQLTGLLFERCQQKLQLDVSTLDQQRIMEYGRAVHAAGCPNEYCFGFIDGTLRETARPNDPILQRPLFNGRKKKHALNFQAVVAPDGLFIHWSKPFAGSVHDQRMLHESGLLPMMDDLPFPHENANLGDVYHLYGDSGYDSERRLVVPFEGNFLPEDRREHNKKMSDLRACVEHSFGKVVNLWKFIDFGKNMKTRLMPVGQYITVAVFLTNCHTCLYGHQASEMFNCRPPTLEEYLSDVWDLVNSLWCVMFSLWCVMNKFLIRACRGGTSINTVFRGIIRKPKFLLFKSNIYTKRSTMRKNIVKKLAATFYTCSEAARLFGTINKIVLLHSFLNRLSIRQFIKKTKPIFKPLWSISISPSVVV